MQPYQVLSSQEGLQGSPTTRSMRACACWTEGGAPSCTPTAARLPPIPGWGTLWGGVVLRWKSEHAMHSAPLTLLATAAGVALGMTAPHSP